MTLPATMTAMVTIGQGDMDMMLSHAVSHAVGACQDMLIIDIAGGRGPHNINGHLHLPEAKRLGVHLDEDTLGKALAEYA